MPPDAPQRAGPISVNIRPGAAVLSVLKHLNYRAWFALAEFVDNAVQSAEQNRAALVALHGAGWRPKVRISIESAQPALIRISDDAAGISLADFPRAFRPAAVPPDRSGLSEFGMGMKSAACWFAPRWEVRTQALGEDVERIVRFDVARIVRDGLEELEVEEVPGRPNGHFTEVILHEPFRLPAGRTIGKIKEHLTDIYRCFIREGRLQLTYNGEALTWVEDGVLAAPWDRDPKKETRIWRKPIDFDLGGGQRVHGFAALRDPGNFSRAGFALFRRKRLIQGSGDEGYRPHAIFGSQNSFRNLRLFVELHLEGFEVSHTKDGFRWDENEEPFVDLLKEHLDTDDMPLLRQADSYRALASRKDRAKAANQALDRTADALASRLEDAVEKVRNAVLIETPEVPLPAQTMLAERTLEFMFRNEPWHIRVELSDEASDTEWLSISNQPPNGSRPQILQLRLAMSHPFTLAFGQLDVEGIEALIRVAGAVGLAEVLARQAGVAKAGTVRRNMNDILQSKLLKRGISLKALDYQKVEPAAGGTVRQVVKIQQGIPTDKAKEVVKFIKDGKYKVQASIQGETVRVSGKDRDTLQEVIAALKGNDFGIDMQFDNYRSS